MLFNSSLFIFLFLPISCFIYFVSPEKLKFYILLILSLLFYYLSEGKYVILLIFSIIFNYSIGRLIQNSSRPRLFLLIGVVTNLVILAYFKIHENLPLGISFFTFQVISYLMDVYRKSVTAQSSVFNMALYVSFFPYISSGPITRYATMGEQLKKSHINLNNIATGIERFIVGMAKKVLIADQLSQLSTISFAISPDNLNFISAWLGAISFASQIYFDFSGYSDMAIGLARIFGFKLEENFNQPYVAISIQDFWRRWHISLSSWLRDYIYIPLGGNRFGKMRTNINVLIVFFICGLWHGIKINFVFWGIYYAFFLILENLFLLNILKRVHKFIRAASTLIVVIVGWVIFRSDSLSYAFHYIATMFALRNFSLPSVVSEQLINYKSITALVISLFIIMPVYHLLPVKKLTFLKPILLIVIFVLSIIMQINTTYNPFLYFRF